MLMKQKDLYYMAQAIKCELIKSKDHCTQAVASKQGLKTCTREFEIEWGMTRVQRNERLLTIVLILTAAIVHPQKNTDLEPHLNYQKTHLLTVLFYENYFF